MINGINRAGIKPGALVQVYEAIKVALRYPLTQ